MKSHRGTDGLLHPYRDDCRLPPERGSVKLRNAKEAREIIKSSYLSAFGDSLKILIIEDFQESSRYKQMNGQVKMMRAVWTVFVGK